MAEQPAPTDIVEMLAEVVLFMDLTDQMAVLLAGRLEQPYEPGDDVQRDVKALAVWFERNPEARAEASAYICTRPGRLSTRTWPNA